MVFVAELRLQCFDCLSKETSPPNRSMSDIACYQQL
jgi:hypothetical protein